MTRARDVADTQDNVGGSVAPFVAGKNKILNSDFSIWQRGTSKVLAQGDTFLADRFRTGMSAISSGTITVSQQTFTPGTAPVAGYESAYFWRIAGTSTPTGLSYLATDQPIEDVRTLAGQTVTFSFWAKSDIARNVDIGYVQYFGVGGSSTLQPIIGTVAVTTSWSRVSVTYTIPSMVGKTIGPGSCGVFRVYHPQNVNFTFDMWGVQLEAGNVATPFTTATGNPASELAACQRYYYRIYNPGSATNNAFAITGFVSATTQVWTPIQHPVKMRVTPTSLDYANVGFYVFRTGGNYQGGTWAINTASPEATCLIYTTSGLTVNDIGVLNQSINGTNVAYLGLNAEL